MSKIFRALVMTLIVAHVLSARADAAVTVSTFKAQAQGAQVRLTWTTASEIGNLGFHILRSDSAGGGFAQITARIIPSQCLGCIAGASYAYVDSPLAPGRAYFYKLQSVASDGSTELFGPVSVANAVPTATATPTRSPTPISSATSVTWGGAPTATRASANPPMSAPPTLTRAPGIATATPVPQTSTRSAIPSPGDATPRAPTIARAIKQPAPEIAASPAQPDAPPRLIHAAIHAAACALGFAALGLGIAALYFFARASWRA